MSGKSFGKLFTVTTFGESHGLALGCIVDGCPPGLELSEADIQAELDRRKPGTSRHVTQRREPDTVEILSGVFEGKTTGTPIGLLIRNQDQRSKDYGNIAEAFRPGHADYAYTQKYGFRDYRGGGRSSARETAMRVAAGAIAKKYLQQKFGIEIRGHVTQIGPVHAQTLDWNLVNQNPFFCGDADAVPKMEELITQLRRDGSSCGARLSVYASNVPAGWGEPVFDRLEADLAKAMLSLPATKGFEIGSGFDGITMTGLEHNDAFRMKGGTVVTVTNRSGGIQGGISNGQPIYFRVAFKPVATVMHEQDTVSTELKNTTLKGRGRHDPCVLPRAVPMVEAMTALVLVDHALRHKAQCV